MSLRLATDTTTWETSIVAVATEIVNDETASSLTTNNEHDIQGVDEVMIRVKTFALDTATSIDLYPQVADSADEWSYITDLGGDPYCFPISGTTRKARALPIISNVRGVKFRILVGSTGTAGNETLSVDIMRFKHVEG